MRGHQGAHGDMGWSEIVTREAAVVAVAPENGTRSRDGITGFGVLISQLLSTVGLGQALAPDDVPGQ